MKIISEKSMSNIIINKILIIRNDKLGDFILSIPTFTLIKQYLPHSQLHAFVPEYTSEIALNCEAIDEVVIDPGTSAKLSAQLKILNIIRAEKYDAIITLYSTTRVGIFSLLSGIKYRLAPATKIAQLFYNHKLTQRRSKSLKPEYEYNLDLGIKYLSDIDIPVKTIPKAPFLQFNNGDVYNIKTEFCKQNNLDINSKFIFIHPGTGGSATNLTLNQYANLAKNLDINNNYTFVITAGPDEKETAEKLSTLMNNLPHIIYHSTEGLINFAKNIYLCELFISGSTGPLHIAGALNRPTAAFYQRRRSATPLRWQTLNSEDRRLAFTPPENEHESNLENIDVIAAAKIINEKFLNN